MDKKTIEFYDKNAKEYAESTFNIKVDEKYVDFIKNIPTGGKILDAGCGSGRDLIAFKNMGFDVIGIDASKELAGIAIENANVEVYNKSFEDIDWKNEFDGIWCMASLLHLKKEDLKEVLIKLSEALKPNGKFYASFKNGEGESYDNKGRFFSYLSKDELTNIFNTIEKFKDVNISFAKDTLGREETQWLNIYATVDKPELNLKKKRTIKP